MPFIIYLSSTAIFRLIENKGLKPVDDVFKKKSKKRKKTSSTRDKSSTQDLKIYFLRLKNAMKKNISGHQKNDSKNPAISLLAMILSAGGTARVNGETGKLEVGPAHLAKRLQSQIVSQKQNLVRLLLRIDCPVCGFSTRMDGQARLEGKKWPYRLKCCLCNWSEMAEMPDFPVIDKSGKEI